MGVPHLTTFLRPYAESGTLVGDNAVIDGPGLAYHIYYVCLSSRSSARNPFEAAPSYEEVGKIALAWLDALQTSGVVIKKIYFDGFLPPSKLDVRSERLAVQTRKLTGYYNTNAVPCRAPTSTVGASLTNLFNTSPVRPGLTTITPAPFLVPAVIDALKSSKNYGGLTIVVPGEADLYCATYLSGHGGLVFTGDPDLLVHDLGPQGAVCFFKDVETTPDSELVLMSGHIYRPYNIADQLDLPKPHRLRALAFETLLNTQGTFRKLLGQAVSLESIEANEGKYKEFCKEYSIPRNLSCQSEVSHVEEQFEILQALQSLDPRISEFVLQAPSLAKIAGHQFPGSDSRHVFLPFLVDCPVRTNAWEISTSVRQLAYGLLNLIVPEVERRYSVFEHRRQQQSSNGREWQLPSISDIPDACSALVTIFDRISTKIADLPSLDLWNAIAIYQDTEYSMSLEKPNVTNLALRQLVDIGGHSDISKNYNWDIIQHIAQVEGSYYSFRSLKQITSLLLVHSRREHLSLAIFQLHDRLASLPSLEARPAYTVQYSLPEIHAMRNFLNSAYDLLGVQDKQSTTITHELSSKPKKRRKKNHANTPVLDLVDKQQSTNPFDLLGGE